jgi:hypothetical protein
MQPLIFPFLRSTFEEGRLIKEREYYSVLFALQEVFKNIFSSPYCTPPDLERGAKYRDRAHGVNEFSQIRH